jgi:sugar lactone lactonase YvrE
MRNAINDAKIKSSGNICVTTGAYPKSQVQVWEIDPADAGKMNGVLAGLFPDVKPNCA